MQSGQNQSPRALLRLVPSWVAHCLAVKRFGLRVFQRAVPPLRVHSRESQISGAHRELKSQQTLLAGLMGELEKRFLSIGQELEMVSCASETLVIGSEEFLKLAAGQIDGQDQFTRAATILRGPLEFLREYQTCLVDLVQELHLRREQIAQACRLEAEIETLLTPLRYIQVLFRIEASRLPSEIQNIFITLTCDIEQIHSKAVESVKSEFSKLEGALEIIDQLIRKLDLKVAEHKVALTQKHQAIEQSLRDLSISVSESQVRDVRLSKTIEDIRTETDQVITGIQFQDITRQKLESVNLALTKLGGSLAEIEKGRAVSAKRSETLGLINQIARVQSSQLAAIDSDLAGAQATMNAALRSTLAKTGELDRDCMTLQNLLSVANADNGMVQIMLNAMAEVRALIASAELLESEIYESIYPLSSLALNLTAIIRQLSFDIKLVALNAQVQAAHLHSGTGLEVLSQKTCVISTGVNSLNEQNGAELNAVAGALHTIVENCGRLRERAHEQKQLLDTDGVEVEGQLHIYRDRVLEVFHSVTERSDQFRQKIEDTLALVEFHPLAAPRLQEAIQSLNTLEGLTVQWKDSAPKMDDATFQRQLRSDYRMSSQRQIHLNTVNQTDPTQLHHEDSTAVEWFDNSAVPSPKKTELPKQESTQPELPMPTAPSKPSSEDFGSNVEMF